MANQSNNARRRPARRTRQRAQNRDSFFGKLLIMLAVAIAIVLGIAIFFRVSEIQVQGNQIYSAEQVAEVCGVELGDNLVMVNRAAVSGSVKTRLPYVQEVSVGLILPGTVVIKVQESEIAGLVEADVGSKWYVNTSGRVLGSSVDGFTGQIVELTGFMVTAPAAGQQAVASADMEESMTTALKVLEAMDGSGLMEQVTRIDTQASYDIRLFCAEQYEVLLGGTEELDYKIWYLQEVLEQLEPYQSGTIDLTLDQERAARFIPWADGTQQTQTGETEQSGNTQDENTGADQEKSE